MSDVTTRPARASVILYARVSDGSVATECRVRNLSDTGACIDNAATLLAGMQVRVTMGVVPELTAEVMWANARLAGLRFPAAIDIADARRPRGKAAVVAPPIPQPPGWLEYRPDPYHKRR